MHRVCGVIFAREPLHSSPAKKDLTPLSGVRARRSKELQRWPLLLPRPPDEHRVSAQGSNTQQGSGTVGATEESGRRSGDSI